MDSGQSTAMMQRMSCPDRTRLPPPRQAQPAPTAAQPDREGERPRPGGRARGAGGLLDRATVIQLHSRWALVALAATGLHVLTVVGDLEQPAVQDDVPADPHDAEAEHPRRAEVEQAREPGAAVEAVHAEDAHEGEQQPADVVVDRAVGVALAGVVDVPRERELDGLVVAAVGRDRGGVELDLRLRRQRRRQAVERLLGRLAQRLGALLGRADVGPSGLRGADVVVGVDAAELGRRLAAVRAEGLPAVVAVDAAGQVLGYCWARPFRPLAAYRGTVEDSIHVAREARRRGVGQALLAIMIPLFAGAAAWGGWGYDGGVWCCASLLVSPALPPSARAGWS